MHTFVIMFTVEGGEAEVMHHDAPTRYEAWQWATTKGMEQMKFYPSLVYNITVAPA